jgi:quercetin dioxygenase-like cupin family protein
MRKTVLVIVALLAGVGILAMANAQEAMKKAVVWPAAEVKWADNPAVKGAKVATLWGDPKTGPYGALKLIPAGGTLGMHTHTEEQKVVIVSGTVLFALEDGMTKELGAGSYLFIPGGTKHKADCKPGADCMYFEEQPGPSDIKFIEGAATKK